MSFPIFCDNRSCCHTPCQIAEDNNAMRIICTTCKKQIVIRKDPYKGVPEKRQYAEVFKKDILQGGDNLFYKYHSEHLKT